MSTKPDWVMTVPVISTAHMPSSDAIVDLIISKSAACAVYDDEGGFVCLPDDPMDEAQWTAPILTWLKQNFGDDSNWVRFDCDAQVIGGLPTYDWSQK